MMLLNIIEATVDCCCYLQHAARDHGN